MSTRAKHAVKFTRDPATSALITQCARRAVALREARGASADRIEIEMDLSATNANGAPLDFAKLLAFDDFNFLHDVLGIADHINRNDGRLTGHFLPRCARTQGARR